LGGLTVARAIMDTMPHESVHYVGDTAHGPYGPLPIAEVRRHALDIMDALVADGVKMLVMRSIARARKPPDEAAASVATPRASIAW